jgi:hypothetical protein
MNDPRIKLKLGVEVEVLKPAACGGMVNSEF